MSPNRILAPIARNNGSQFTVLSAVTQRSSKNAEDEWAESRVASRLFNRLGESVADTLHEGDHVLVDGQLVSSKYERENGKSEKAKATKFAILWSVGANSVRRLSRAEAEVPAQASAPEHASEDAPF